MRPSRPARSRAARPFPAFQPGRRPGAGRRRPTGRRLARRSGEVRHPAGRGRDPGAQAAPGRLGTAGRRQHGRGVEHLAAVHGGSPLPRRVRAPCRDDQRPSWPCCGSRTLVSHGRGRIRLVELAARDDCRELAGTRGAGGGSAGDGARHRAIQPGFVHRRTSPATGGGRQPSSDCGRWGGGSLSGPGRQLAAAGCGRFLIAAAPLGPGHAARLHARPAARGGASSGGWPVGGGISHAGAGQTGRPAGRARAIAASAVRRAAGQHGRGATAFGGARRPLQPAARAARDPGRHAARRQPLRRSGRDVWPRHRASPPTRGRRLGIVLRARRCL